MRVLKKGDTVTAALFSGEIVIGKVTDIYCQWQFYNSSYYRLSNSDR